MIHVLIIHAGSMSNIMRLVSAQFFSNELFWRKGMVACTKPQQWKEEESERLRGEGDQAKFVDLRLERWQVVNSREQEEGKTFHKLHVLGMSDDLWDNVRGLGSET